MEHKISEPNARVDVADVLRGLAVMGIIILHSIEHFNFYSFPDTVPCEWMKFSYLERTLFCLQQQSIRHICPTVRL